MLDGLLVALSPLLLEDDFHLAFSVLDDCRFNFDFFRRHNRATSQCELAGADFVYFGEREDVA